MCFLELRKILKSPHPFNTLFFLYTTLSNFTFYTHPVEHKMNQDGSLFFRLPRELRDDVYRYYIVDGDGFTYDLKHDRLRTTSGAKIDLALQYTCKRVASEMDGLVLQLNTITFHAISDHPYPATEHSNAVLFAYLLKGRLKALQHMLFWARTLVTPSTMAELVRR